VSGYFEEPIEHAAALCDAGSFEEASTLLARLVEIEPEDWRAWSLLAHVELGAGRNEPALNAAEQACRLSPRSAFPRLAASFALDGLGREDEALEQAREAVRIDPFDWRGLDRLVRLLSRDRSRLVEARELAERMQGVAPEQPRVHLTAGGLAAAAGDRAGAQRAFRRALELDPGNATAQHGLAGLHLRHRANDPAALAAAAAGFSRAIRADPEARRSRTALEAILRLFLSKAAYLLLVDAYLVGRLSATSSKLAPRLLPVLLLLIPSFYAWRFCSHLTPSLRRRLARVILDAAPLRFAVACEAFAVAAIVVGAGAAQSLRPGLGGTAGVLALLGRIVIYTQLEHASRAARGEARRPAVRPGFVWVLGALVVGMFLVVLVAAAVR
jgi:tetratricopeptide (TPR) repeat protein